MIPSVLSNLLAARANGLFLFNFKVSDWLVEFSMAMSFDLSAEADAVEDPRKVPASPLVSFSKG